jgi:hypothetical protein
MSETRKIAAILVADVVGYSLAGKLEILANAEDTVDRLLDEDAQTLLDRLMSGVGAALSSFGDRAAAMTAKIGE